MVSEGWCVSISLPSSTMEIKWPMAGVGYRTIASMADRLIEYCVCVCPFNLKDKSGVLQALLLGLRLQGVKV